MPIYGRGRTYFALVGAGINANMIEESGHFLCGACSCQVKEDNPGIDMLLAVNWSDRIKGSAMPEVILPELTGIGSLELAAQSSGSTATPPVDSQPSPDADPTLQVAARAQTPDEQTNNEATPVPTDVDPGSSEQETVSQSSDVSTVEPSHFERNLVLGVVGGTLLAVVLLTLATLAMRRG